MGKKKQTQNTSQTGNAAAIEQLGRLREQGLIGEETYSAKMSEALKQQTTTGGKNVEWVELETFPVRFGDGGNSVVRATQRTKNGVTTFGVSLGIDAGENHITKRFIPLEDVDATVEGIRVMQKAAKAAAKKQ